MALSHPQFGLGAGAHQEVPICAVLVMAADVVLARRSGLGWVRSAASTALAAECGPVCLESGWVASVRAIVAAPAMALATLFICRRIGRRRTTALRERQS